MLVGDSYRVELVAEKKKELIKNIREYTDLLGTCMGSRTDQERINTFNVNTFTTEVLIKT